ncbi:hypothetical protein MKX03_001112 [Papaver bracteatum]|nr:hypothetical protein MKX03_001112 [Papaver bracteatum]
MAYQNLIFVFLCSLVLISVTRMKNTSALEFFDTKVGVDYCRQTLEKATNFIWKIFGQSNDMLVKPFDGVASHTGDEIQVNIKTEITGIIYHELTHVWKWDGIPGPRAPQDLCVQFYHLCQKMCSFKVDTSL